MASVTSEYEYLFGREPSEEAKAYWEQWQEENPDASLRDTLRASAQGTDITAMQERDAERAAAEAGSGQDNSGQDSDAGQSSRYSQVQALYQELLGREGLDANVMNWVNSTMSIDEIRSAIAGSPEGQYYAQVGDTLGAATGLESLEVTPEAVSQLYQANLGRPGQEQYIMNWVNSGMSLAEIERALIDSPEGQNFLTTGQPVGGLDELNALIEERATQSGTTDTGNFNPLIQQYYQELFNRQAQQPGLDYFSGRLGSGDLTEATLRDAIIAGAQGSDRLYYDASQSGGPVFDATQALFGRRPARGTYNPETGQLEGGYGQYRSQIDAGELTPEQLRGRLVQLAYDRGQGGGSSADYQNYLNTLGIDRGGRPFLQDDGTYANVGYGSDLSQYRRTYGDQGQFPDFPYRGRGKGGLLSAVYGQQPSESQAQPSGAARMPGQYITGNQLYSGMPYGMSQPMGMFLPQQPFNYGYSSQYMPNRGLMSGYSTGFGPYGGFQRPRFGGGKGGMMRRPMQYGMGGGKGGFGY